MMPVVGYLPSFFVTTPGHLHSLSVPTPRNLPIVSNANAQGLAPGGEGWALLELTDA